MSVTFRKERCSGFLEGIYRVSVSGTQVGTIYPLNDGAFGHADGRKHGWYFVVVHETLCIRHRNTCGEIGRSLGEVKAAAKAYVLEQLEGAK